MARPDPGISLRAKLIALAAAICGAAISAPASAQPEGDVYIAGNGFSFQQAADQGISRTPSGQRFFLLVLPPETNALTTAATSPLVALRDRVVASNGVLYVCQRDIDSGKIGVSSLVPGVVRVRGWLPVGDGGLPEGEKYYPDENPANFPVSTNSMRQLRSACSR